MGAMLDLDALLKDGHISAAEHNRLRHLAATPHDAAAATPTQATPETVDEDAQAAHDSEQELESAVASEAETNQAAESWTQLGMAFAALILAICLVIFLAAVGLSGSPIAMLGGILAAACASAACFSDSQWDRWRFASSVLTQAACISAMFEPEGGYGILFAFLAAAVHGTLHASPMVIVMAFGFVVARVFASSMFGRHGPPLVPLWQMAIMGLLLGLAGAGAFLLVVRTAKTSATLHLAVGICSFLGAMLILSAGLLNAGFNSKPIAALFLIEGIAVALSFIALSRMTGRHVLQQIAVVAAILWFLIALVLAITLTRLMPMGP